MPDVHRGLSYILRLRSWCLYNVWYMFMYKWYLRNFHCPYWLIVLTLTLVTLITFGQCAMFMSIVSWEMLTFGCNVKSIHVPNQTYDDLVLKIFHLYIKDTAICLDIYVRSRYNLAKAMHIQSKYTVMKCLTQLSFIR